MNNILAALMNGTVSSAALALIVSVALKMIPRNSLNAATRYAIWWAVLLATVAMPFSYLPGPSQPPRSQQSVTSLPVTQPLSASPDDMIVATEIASSKAAPSAPRFRFPIEIPTGPWPARVAIAWIAISGLLLIRLFASAVMLELSKARATVAPKFLATRVACSRRSIRIGVSREIQIPLASGPRRPTILLPAKLLDELAPPELEQIVIHEAAHLARCDDYALLIQRVIQALFALHPVVAFACARIDLEREIACDDFVIASTGNALPYASCLARVVQLSGGVRALPLAAAAAEDRSHLARRVEMLLDNTRQSGTRLLGFRLTVAAIFIAAFAWSAEQTPRLLAFAHPLPSRLASPPAEPAATSLPLPDISQAPAPQSARLLAQAAPPPVPTPPAASPAFEVVSIRPNQPAAGQFIFRNYKGVPAIHVTGNRFADKQATLQDLIMQAYSTWDYQISGLPDWAQSPGGEHYDVEATLPATATPSQEQLQLMARAILADRFHLALHRELKELPVYALTLAKGGSKMTEPPGDAGSSIQALINLLSRVVDKPIVDKTALAGSYDLAPLYALHWAQIGEEHRANPLSIPEAIESTLDEKMGLKLEARREPLEILVIDHAEKASPNQ